MKKNVFLIITCILLVSFIKKEVTITEYDDYIIQESILKKSIKRGKEIYKDMCSTCHLPNGEGVKKIYPPLAKADYLMNKREESIKAIKYGLQGEIIVNGISYNNDMAAMGLYNDEVADVMNYITNSWGNENKKMITEAEVSAVSIKEVKKSKK